MLGKQENEFSTNFKQLQTVRLLLPVVHCCHWTQSNQPSRTVTKPVQCKAGQTGWRNGTGESFLLKRSSVIQTYFLKDLLSPSLAPVPQERCTLLLCSVLSTLYHSLLVVKGSWLVQTGQGIRKDARSENRRGHGASGTLSACVRG